MALSLFRWLIVIARNSSFICKRLAMRIWPTNSSHFALRARHWATALSNGKYDTSMQELATSAKLQAKVIRQKPRFAFLSTGIVDAILNGSELSLAIFERLRR